MLRDVFIFVPAYNVAKTLGDVLSRIPQQIWNRSNVLVIDDGSRDETEKAFFQFACGSWRKDFDDGEDAFLQYHRFEKNSGYGAVVKFGIEQGLASGAKFIACLHGDAQYPPEKLPEFIQRLEGSPSCFSESCAKGMDCPDLQSKSCADLQLGDCPDASSRTRPDASVRNCQNLQSESCPDLQLGACPDSCEIESRGIALVQGSRHAVAGEARKGGMPLYKRLGGKFLTGLENLAFKQPLTDRHSGFIVYSSEFLKTVSLDKLSSSFDIDLELISIADSSDFLVKEIPIPTRYAGEKSNLNVITYGLRCLRLVFRRILKKGRR